VVVLTPDDDLFLEQCSTENPDLAAIRFSNDDGSLPYGLGAAYGAPVYRFQRWPDQRQLQGLLDEARRIADEAVRAAPERFGSVAGDRSGAEGRLPLLDVGAPPGDGRRRYVCSSVTHQATVGDIVDLSRFRVTYLHDEKYAVCEQAGEPPFMCCRSDVCDSAGLEAELSVQGFERGGGLGPGAQLPSAPGGSSGSVEDARTLAVRRSKQGQRYRSLREAVEDGGQVEFDDFPIEGPRTVAWYLGEVAKTGHDPSSRHVTWKHENDVKDDQRIAEVHEALSEVLDLAITYDQLDCSNLAFAECAARRLQQIEHDQRRKTEAKKGHNHNEFYLGRSNRAGNNLMSPELQKFVASKASSEASILKEQRKAEEERALARKSDKGGK
jgi:hypothetical protein